jgi:hypothetical protein
MARTDSEYAAHAIVSHNEAAVLLNLAQQKVDELGSQRAEKKVAAVERLMTEKAWPMSRAENYAQLDGEYHAYKRECDQADLARLTAALNVQNAELTARFYIAQLAEQDTAEVEKFLARMRADLKAVS